MKCDICLWQNTQRCPFWTGKEHLPTNGCEFGKTLYTKEEELRFRETV